MIEQVLSAVNFVAGDANSIRIGSDTNIQDHSLVTVGGSRAPTVIGNNVTVGESSRHSWRNLSVLEWSN